MSQYGSRSLPFSTIGPRCDIEVLQGAENLWCGEMRVRGHDATRYGWLTDEREKCSAATRSNPPNWRLCQCSRGSERPILNVHPSWVENS